MYSKEISRKKKNQLITFYERIDDELCLTVPYSNQASRTLKRWGSRKDQDNQKWLVPPERIKNLINLLGDQSLPLVRVRVPEDQISGKNTRSHYIGLYVLSFCSGLTSGINVHAELIEGELSPGGSQRFPKIISEDAVYALWVPTDFAIKRNLQIINGEDYQLSKAKELLEAQLVEIESLIRNQE